MRLNGGVISHSEMAKGRLVNGRLWRAKLAGILNPLNPIIYSFHFACVLICKETLHAEQRLPVLHDGETPRRLQAANAAIVGETVRCGECCDRGPNCQVF